MEQEEQRKGGGINGSRSVTQRRAQHGYAFKRVEEGKVEKGVGRRGVDGARGAEGGERDRWISQRFGAAHIMGMSSNEWRGGGGERGGQEVGRWGKKSRWREKESMDGGSRTGVDRLYEFAAELRARCAAHCIWRATEQRLQPAKKQVFLKRAQD